MNIASQNRRSCFRLACLVALVVACGCSLASNSQNSDGVRMFDQAYYQGAQQKFLQAIQSDPNNPDSYYNLARTYQQLGKLHNQPADLDQAEHYYNQCLDKDPNRTDCYRALAVLLSERGRTADAYRLMEGWAARNPHLAEPKIELARLYEESGNKDAAKHQLIDAITAEPTNARALAALGKLREDAGETQQALANYQRSLQLNPNQPELASRVVSLGMPQFAVGAPVQTPPGGTRVVTTPQVTPVR